MLPLLLLSSPLLLLLLPLRQRNILLSARWNTFF
jgi:hypothetical protein